MLNNTAALPVATLTLDREAQCDKNGNAGGHTVLHSVMAVLLFSFYAVHQE